MDTRGTKLTWLGHATFKIETREGKTILIDPWVAGNPACPDALKKFSKIDLMLITHGHNDHFGDAVALAKQHKPTVVAIYEIGEWLAAQGVEKVSGMGKGGTQVIDGVAVTMVHAIHSSSIAADGQIVYAGEPCGYVIRFPGGFSLYHAGDTTVFGDMKIIGEIYRPDLALLPIGGHYTMGPHEAAYALCLLGVKGVIPMHYGTFPVLTGTPAALKQEAKGIPNLEVITLQPGQTLG